MCKLCNLRVICAQGWERSLAKLFDPGWFPRRGVRDAGVRTVCVRSGALACSQQLLQMVCSLCHPLSRHCLWRAIKQQSRQRQACFASNRKIREVDCGSRSFITWVPPYLASVKVSHTGAAKFSECLILSVWISPDWYVKVRLCSQLLSTQSLWLVFQAWTRLCLHLRLIACPPRGPASWPDWDLVAPIKHVSGPYSGFDSH